MDILTRLLPGTIAVVVMAGLMLVSWRATDPPWSSARRAPIEVSIVTSVPAPVPSEPSPTLRLPSDDDMPTVEVVEVTKPAPVPAAEPPKPAPWTDPILIRPQNPRPAPKSRMLAQTSPPRAPSSPPARRDASNAPGPRLATMIVRAREDVHDWSIEGLKLGGGS